METIDHLKKVAKKLARSQRMKLSAAQNLVAQSVGMPHWPALVTATNRGWTTTDAAIDQLERNLRTANPLLPGAPADAGGDQLECLAGVSVTTATLVPRNIFTDKTTGRLEGEIDAHAFVVSDDGDDVEISGRGWAVTVQAAPSAEPYWRITDRRIRRNPISDPDFRERVIGVANLRQAQVRARMATEWPRHALVPDRDGRITHPVVRAAGRKWWCSTCAADLTATRVAENFWYCPSCNASPTRICLDEG